MKKCLVFMLVFVLCIASAALAETPGYVETVVSIDAGDHQIPATVCMPTAEGTYPAVVMLHGTGSNRDEAGGGYAYAAPVLAEKYGVATIRIDFMGNGESTADYTGYTFESAVADAVAAAEYIAAQENIDGEHIGVMGWSQGGTDALLAAGQHPEIFKSVVTWAGAPDLGLLLTDEDYAEAQQNGYFTMEFDWREPLNVSLQWCEDVKNINVLDVFTGFDGPVLAIHGTEDTTVDPDWSNKIAGTSTNEASGTCFIEGMDHTFNVFTEEDLHSLYTAIDATGEFFAATLK
ncbi:MAG: alpha/beta fold hydrolase [Clostridia bacterium]|nr:alpha/beta fold hydrolase [Clostridia bacterium]